MALFNNKADEDLNILTVFYQAEFPKEFAGFLISRYFYLPEVAGDLDPTENRGEVEAKVARFQKAVRALLDSFADDSDIQAEDIETIKHLVDTATNSTKYSLTSVKRAVIDGKEIPFGYQIDKLKQIEVPVQAKNLCVLGWVQKDKFAVELGEAIIDLVGEGYDRIDEDKKVARCAECNNPFVLTRGEHRFCSQRCSHRAGERRRYRERFEGYKAVKMK